MPGGEWKKHLGVPRPRGWPSGGRHHCSPAVAPRDRPRAGRVHRGSVLAALGPLRAPPPAHAVAVGRPYLVTVSPSSATGAWKSVMAPAVVLSGCASRCGFCRPKSCQLRPARSQPPPACVSGSLRPVRGGVRFTLRERLGQFPYRTHLPGGHPLPHLRRLPLERQRRVCTPRELPGRCPHPMRESRMPPRVLPSLLLQGVLPLPIMQPETDTPVRRVPR